MAIEKPLTILFYGPSGAGKGTQAKLLKEFLEKEDSSRQTEYIETGAMLRKFIEKEGHTEELAKQIMDEGGLLPSFIPIYLWTKYFIEEFQGEEHVLLDGLARRPHEVVSLNEALHFYKRDDYTVISFELSEERAAARLRSRARGDDLSDEAIKEKMNWYRQSVVPAIEHFRKCGGRIITMDADPSIEEIHASLIEKLRLRA